MDCSGELELILFLKVVECVFLEHVRVDPSDEVCSTLEQTPEGAQILGNRGTIDDA